MICCVLSKDIQQKYIKACSGGELSLKTGEKEDVENAAENVPYTGIMDLMVNHLKVCTYLFSSYYYNITSCDS